MTAILRPFGRWLNTASNPSFIIGYSIVAQQLFGRQLNTLMQHFWKLFLLVLGASLPQTQSHCDACDYRPGCMEEGYVP